LQNRISFMISFMRVRLIKKLAQIIDGVDLGASRPGDTLELPDPKAHLLIAEQWAVPERRSVDRAEDARQFKLRDPDRDSATPSSSPSSSTRRELSVAADRRRRQQRDTR
jgi:hypothetical protein